MATAAETGEMEVVEMAAEAMAAVTAAEATEVAAMVAVMAAAAKVVAMEEHRSPHLHSIVPRATQSADRKCTRCCCRLSQPPDARSHMNARTAPIPTRTPHRDHSRCAGSLEAPDECTNERRTDDTGPPPRSMSRYANSHPYLRWNYRTRQA